MGTGAGNSCPHCNLAEQLRAAGTASAVAARAGDSTTALRAILADRAALGTAFAIAWGLMMWFFVWSRQGMSPLAALVAAAVAGALFGLSMATYYAYGRRKYQLPEWRSLGEGNART